MSVAERPYPGRIQPLGADSAWPRDRGQIVLQVDARRAVGMCWIQNYELRERFSLFSFAIMMRILQIICLLPIATLAACVTDTSAPTAFSVARGESSITVTRSDDMLYLAAAASVELNGVKIASLGRGESYSGGVASGPAVVTVSAWASPGASTYRFTVEPGKAYRLTVTPRGASFGAAMMGGVIGQAIEGGGPFQVAPST